MNGKILKSTKLLSVRYGETPMGTGPHGGHCGYQWMADFDVDGWKVTDIILNKEDRKPTEEELRKSYLKAQDCAKLQEREFIENKALEMKNHKTSSEILHLSRKIEENL